MTCLIDTNILLWFLFAPEKIKKSAREILEREETIVFASSISLWEISLKFSLGKLQVKEEVMERIIPTIEESGVVVLNPQPQLFASFYKLPRLHKDPFDRLIVWQAINYNLTLITADKNLAVYQNFGLRIIC